MSVETSRDDAARSAISHEAATSAQLARERRDQQVIRAHEQSRKLLKGSERAECANAMAAYAPDAAHRPASSRLKRLIDVVGAGIGLVFLAPFLLLVALIIRLESHGPVLFRQRRKGRGGVPFVIYKFRTMRCLEDGPEIRQAERDDCRTTWLGAFLRRSSIDELPQLLNVLKGDMSLVGPRPHALAHDEFYGAAVENYDARFLARPGISGLAQVSGLRGATPTVEWMTARVALDLEYITRWSIALDLRILWQTLLIGPFDPGAF
jgi:putative colanic acid biosysnthesis UDP-glucose lipid carrier transferase